MKHLFFVALTLFSLNAVAGLEPAFKCAYTNDGEGGDEGYEIEVVKNAVGDYHAILTVTDPGGQREYKSGPVSKGVGKHGGDSWTGQGIYIEVYNHLPTAEGGYFFSWMNIPDDVGGRTDGPTLCKGPDLRAL